MMVLALVLAASSAAPKLAMPEWSRVEVTPELAAFYADHFAVELRKNGLGVVTSQEIASLLGMERQKALLGCTDASSSCMAELGNALGCAAVIKVSVAKLDETVRANISVLSSVDGSVKVETSVAAEGQAKFFWALDGAAAMLAEKLTPPKVMTGGRVRSLWWIPSAIGAVALGLGIAGTAIAAKAYADLDQATSYGDARVLVANGKSAHGFGALMFAVAGVALVTAVLMVVLGGPVEVTPAVEVAPGGVTLRW